MKLRQCVFSSLFALGCLSTSASVIASVMAAPNQGYYRAPAIHDQTVVFTAEGDLWKSQLSSPLATRLTTQDAEELDASISHDGKWVAYTANYDGATEVYVMPIEGGVAKRLTFENSRVTLQGWTHDGQVLYATDNAFGPSSYWVLKTVEPSTLNVTHLPLADAIEGSIDAKGEYVYFTQFGLQTSGDNAKVYRGGAKGEIWRYKLASDQEAVKLTGAHQGSVSQPMVWQDRVYFLSDDSGNSNIWSMSHQGADIKQHTFFKDWQVRHPQLSKGSIVFQQGADIILFDIASNQTRKLDIALTSDFAQRREKWVNNPMDYATSVNFSHQGEQVVITARSHVVVAGNDGRRLVTINTPKDSRIAHAQLSDNGQYVYAISDASGEQELWRFAADGSDDAKQLTRDGNTLRTGLHLSPNGKYIAHDDYHGNVWLLNLAKGKNVKVIQNGEGLAEYQDIVWSHDSRYLALTKAEQGKQRPQVVLYSVAENKEVALTTDKYESFSPTFSHDGKWLYFLSNRAFNATPGSPWGDRNMGPIFDKRTQIFALALDPKAEFPFAKSTELTKLSANKEAKDDKSNSNKVKLDWQGLSSRLWQVPIEAGNYHSLLAAKDRLYWLDAQPKGANLVHVKFDNKAPKKEVFSEDVAQYQLSKDLANIMLRRAAEPAQILIVAAGDKIAADVSTAAVNLSQWQLNISPVQEWQQMFEDAWLMHRDSFFDTNMRGLNWQETKQKYQPLLARLTDRLELNDIFKQMMGELDSLHSQVRGGDINKPANLPQGAALGARLTQQPSKVVIAHIYQSDAERPNQLAPLARMGVDAKVGDEIVAINGINISSIAQVTSLLRNQANQQVLLTLKRGRETHQTVVEPLTTREDAKMRYLDWVYHNVSKVQKASEGEIGYLHLYSMVSADIESFAREFYTHYDKQGLIIDVRRNRGGNIDSWIIEKLLRRTWAFWQPTYGSAHANMQQTFRGHLVVLTDQMTYSDGETFAAGIKALGLAPLIGKQTAGAGVWLSGRNAVTDKGMARVAEYPQYAIDGSWIVEGHGVEPDIEVDNLPYETYQGRDAQLEAAIEYLKNELIQQPILPLEAKPLPQQGIAKDVGVIGR